MIIKLGNGDKTSNQHMGKWNRDDHKSSYRKTGSIGIKTFVQEEAAGTEWPTYLEILMATPATEETKLAMKNKVYCF